MRRRRWLVLAGLIAAAAAVYYFFAFTTHIRWGSSYDLTVHVESARPVRAVSCEVFGRHNEYVDDVVRYAMPSETRNGMFSTTVDPYVGEPITVRVITYGRESYTGRNLSRDQFRFLVVVVTYADGRRVAKLVDIPDGRVSREVRITFD